MNIFLRSSALGLGALALSGGAARAENMQTVELNVDGVTRTALVYVPAKAKGGAPLPLVFAFHGHGGNSSASERKFQVDQLWPQAISVYPQGLNTPGGILDPSGQTPGWQKMPGDQEDRDLHFFDALLGRIEKDYSVDPKRIYATGHSNGGGFTNLLWFTHPKVLAAVAVCSGGNRYTERLIPKPAMILCGKNDELVPFASQQTAIETLRRVNGCEGAGQPWQGLATLYPSKSGTPLVTYIYDGAHAMDANEPGLIVKFFQEHP